MDTLMADFQMIPQKAAYRDSKSKTLKKKESPFNQAVR